MCRLTGSRAGRLATVERGMLTVAGSGPRVGLEPEFCIWGSAGLLPDVVDQHAVGMGAIADQLAGPGG
jgi:hypothetical protein